MIRKNIWFAALLVAALSTRLSVAQGNPTAIQPLQLSVFGGLSGVYTALAPSFVSTGPGGKNLSITAGVDLGLLSHHGIRPVIEVRGTLPIDKGNVDDEKSILFGGKFEFWMNHRLHPYGDFLFGRGPTDYPGGYIYGNYQYNLTTTNVLSPGGGGDFDLTRQLAIKGDFQYQHWGSEPTPSGVVWSKAITAAVVYHFDFNNRHRR